MNKTIKQIAKNIIEERRYKEIEAMKSLTEKCKRCFHYQFQDSKEVKWDYTFVPIGHVCDYSVFANPLRELIVWGEVRDTTNATLDGSLNDFSHVYQSQNGKRTIERRIDLGECEFKEFPEPRSRPWGEKDENWDSKYKNKFVELLKPNLVKQGFLESRIPQIIAEEFGEA